MPLSAGVNQANDVTLGYNATAGVGSSFTGANLFQTGGFAGTGSATVKDSFCLGSLLIGCSGANGLSLQTQQNSITLSPTATTPISATFVDISKDILTTSNGAGGMASLSVASNTLKLTPNPEPVSLLLMGSGLLGLGVIGRRKRKA